MISETVFLRERRRRTANQHVRLACACVILALFLAVIALYDSAESLASSANTTNQIANGTFSAAADEATGQCRSRFESEVLYLDGLQDVKTSESCSVVGFSVAGTAEDAFLDIGKRLGERGWVAVESGSAVAGSFVKESGEIRWAFLSCSQVGEQTCAVLQTI